MLIQMAELCPSRGSPSRRIVQQKGTLMSDSITDEQFEFLLSKAGLSLTAEQKATIKATYPFIAAMTARNAKPRSRMDEPAHLFIPGAGVVA